MELYALSENIIDFSENSDILLVDNKVIDNENSID